MTETTSNPGPRIIPILRYADAPAAIEWLGEAFGFEERLVVPGADGAIRHAQLVCQGSMIMLGTIRDDDLGVLHRPPNMLGGVGSQSLYIVVADADAHCARAAAAGAEILLDVAEQEPEGRFYSCRDPEGHVWNFGTYDPFAG